jgi:hypothetical protein
VRHRRSATVLYAIGLDKPGRFAALFRREMHAVQQAWGLPGFDRDRVPAVQALHDARSPLSEAAVAIEYQDAF